MREDHGESVFELGLDLADGGVDLHPGVECEGTAIFDELHDDGAVALHEVLESWSGVGVEKFYEQIDLCEVSLTLDFEQRSDASSGETNASAFAQEFERVGAGEHDRA